MATETLDATPPRRKGRVAGFLKTLLGSSVMAAAGFGAGWWYFANPMSPAQDVLRLIGPESVADSTQPVIEDNGAGQKKLPKPVPEKELFVTSYFTFPEPLTSNIAGSKRFVQLQIGVSTQYDAAVIANVEAHIPALTSDILAIVSTFAEDTLNGPEGRSALADAIRTVINARLEKMEGFGGIEDVFFPSFVLQ